MKKITRIEDVYTVPKTEEVCDSLGIDSRYIDIGIKKCDNWLGTTLPIDEETLIEIPVDRFLDLISDKITHWRLEEVGFERIDDEQFQLNTGDGNFISFLWPSLDVVIQNKDTIIPLNITTFTELLQQMKFLGWKNERE